MRFSRDSNDSLIDRAAWRAIDAGEMLLEQQLEAARRNDRRQESKAEGRRTGRRYLDSRGTRCTAPVLTTATTGAPAARCKSSCAARVTMAERANPQSRSTRTNAPIVVSARTV